MSEPGYRGGGTASQGEVSVSGASSRGASSTVLSIGKKAAQSPRTPEATAASQRAAAERQIELRAREQAESARMVRGLAFLAVLVLLLSLLHAGWERAFVPGWWRQW